MASALVSASPQWQMFSPGGSLPNMKMYFASATTSGGMAAVYPTTTGTASGTAVFSQILHSDCMAWSGSTTPSGSILCSGKAISSDLRTISFNLVGGTGVLLGGTTLAFAPDNTPVTCVVYGV